MRIIIRKRGKRKKKGRRNRFRVHGLGFRVQESGFEVGVGISGYGKKGRTSIEIGHTDPELMVQSRKN